MMLFTITDQRGDHTATVAAHDIADAISPWFPQTPQVAAAIADLQATVEALHDTSRLEEYLGVRVRVTTVPVEVGVRALADYPPPDPATGRSDVPPPVAR